MFVYVVFEIVEDEYCGEEVCGVFATELSAAEYVKENQSQFEHWSDKIVDRMRYERFEVH